MLIVMTQFSHNRLLVKSCLLALLTFLFAFQNPLNAQNCNPDLTPPNCVPPANVTVPCEAFDPSLLQYGVDASTDDCCMSTVIVTKDYSNFDTVCNRGTIVRKFKAVDCSGNTSECSQSIVVNYNQS